MQEFDATVTRIIDGDTLEVTLHMKILDMTSSLGGIRIRIAALSAPERFTDKGKIATGAASSLLLGKKVRLLCTGSKTFDRYVGEVIVEGVNFTTFMVENGYGTYHAIKL